MVWASAFSGLPCKSRRELGAKLGFVNSGARLAIWLRRKSRVQSLVRFCSPVTSTMALSLIPWLLRRNNSRNSPTVDSGPTFVTAAFTSSSRRRWRRPDSGVRSDTLEAFRFSFRRLPRRDSGVRSAKL